jgi:predicted TIM-barrel fold metal-dependent hydrolase
MSGRKVAAGMIADPATGERYSVVDVHQHLTFGEGTEQAAPIRPRLDVLDRFGIDRAVLLPPSGAFGGKRMPAAEINARTSAVARAHPDRFLCGVAHVELGDGPAECARVIDQAVGDLGLRGVAWHHRFQGAYLDHPAMPDLLRQCARLRVPALVHVISGSGLEAAWRLGALLRECPETTVCALDAFSSTEQAAEITELARRHHNLSCDLGAMISVSGWMIRRFIDAVGPGRLLFGTDLYMTPRTWYAPGPLYEILHMDIPAASKKKILAGNALAMFEPTQPQRSTTSMGHRCT